MDAYSDIVNSANSAKQLMSNFKAWRDNCIKLYEQGQYFEGFTLLLVLAEAELRILISISEATLVIEIHGRKFAPSYGRRDKLGRLTIGELISWLNVYCEDEQFIQSLKMLNQTRTKYVHNLLREDPSTVNAFLKKQRKAHLKLLVELGKKTTLALEEIIIKLGSVKQEPGVDLARVNDVLLSAISQFSF